MKLKIKARSFLWLCMFLLPAADLFAVQRFDFYCRDGQHVRNAQIESETEEGYFVRLAYLPELIFVDKGNLSGPPVPIKSSVEKKKDSEPQKKPVALPGKWKFGLVGGVTYASLMFSPLSEIFNPAPIFSAGAIIVMPKPWLYFLDGFQVFGIRYQYASDPRYVNVSGAFAGIRLAWWRSERLALKLVTELSAGMAFIDMRGFTFEQKNKSVILNSLAGITFNPGTFYFSAGLTLDFVQDSDVMFNPVGVVARVGFTL
jgi:hypothetical protein